MCERGLDDPARRTADLAVARVEVGALSVVEVRNHDRGRDGRPRDSEPGDRSTLDPPPPRDGVPHAESCDDERDLLLASGCGDGEDGEREEAVLVEEPE